MKPLAVVSLCFWIAVAAWPDESQDRLDVIRYGTETEIAALIESLKKDPSYEDDNLDAELARIAQTTQNRKILAGALSFFGHRQKGDLEERAVAIIENRVNEPQDVVIAAIEYCGNVKPPGAASGLKAVIDDGASDVLGPAIRALGSVADSGGSGGSDGPDEIAEFLIDLYTNRDPGAGNNGTLLTALGETKSGKAVPFLAGIAGDTGQSSSLRIAALDALSKIGDNAGLDAILGAVSASEPTVRTAAVAALAPFSGQRVDEAILGNFRDPIFRTRAAAAKAAGERKLSAAIPFLKYRAEKDDARIVREASIRALGAIGSGDALSALDALFSEPKNPDYVRLPAAEMLLNNNADAYVQQVIDALDDAQKKHRTALYNGFLGILSRAKSGKLESLAARLFASGSAMEKSAALDMALNNTFTSLTEEVRNLADQKNSALAAKAQKVLEKL
ncbi:MAG: HEAT repeat domain-containing protein [Treponema sp.]|jgi:HEAT repeat protein|nr:HEAT repeat domain-containing protein [Treponema sp.]